MASIDRLSALQDRRLASLSHTTTLIIIHDDSEAAADATRQALQLHRASRSCIEVPLQTGLALMAEGGGDHAPAAAGAIASFPPAQPADPSSGDGGGSGGSSSGSSSGGGSSNSPSESPSESGDGVAEVLEDPLLMHRELLRLAPDRGFQRTEPASKRRRTVKLKSRGNWVPWGPTEQDGTTQCARGRPDWRQASGAQREYGVRSSPGQQVGVEPNSHAYSSYSHACSALSAAEARERAYYAQQEREQTQAMVEEAAAQGHARVGTSRDHVVDAEDAIDTPPSTPPPASPPPTEPPVNPSKVPRPPTTITPTSHTGPSSDSMRVLTHCATLAQVMTTPAKQALPRPPGRPYGSTNKVNGRKVLFGKQNKGQWHLGKYELQPGVSMVCLAAVDKETGHAQRGVIAFSRRRHYLHTEEGGGGHAPVSSSPPLAHTPLTTRGRVGSRPPLPPFPPSASAPPPIPPRPFRPTPHIAHLPRPPRLASGCGMVLTPEKIRWAFANKVAHVADGCPCAVIWTHGGGCRAGRDGLFRPAVLRPDWMGDASPDGNIQAWRAVQAQEEQPHVGQYSGYRLHSGQPASAGSASASEAVEAWRRRTTPAATKSTA